MVLCCLFPEWCFVVIPVWYQVFQCIPWEINQEDLDLEIEAATARPQNEKLIFCMSRSCILLEKIFSTFIFLISGNKYSPIICLYWSPLIVTALPLASSKKYGPTILEDCYFSCVERMLMNYFDILRNLESGILLINGLHQS